MIKIHKMCVHGIHVKGVGQTDVDLSKPTPDFFFFFDNAHPTCNYTITVYLYYI